MTPIVYTTIIGNFDYLKEPLFTSGLRFVCFTDQPFRNTGHWEVVNIRPAHEDPVKASRYYKMLCPFSGPSVWIDSSFVVKADIKELLDLVGEHDRMGCFPHPHRDCLYQEALAARAAVRQKRRSEQREIIRRQIVEYRDEGMPPRDGILCCGVIVRPQPTPDFDLEWWNEYNRWSIRDQLSFNYLRWLLDFPVTKFPGNVRMNDWFKWCNRYATKETEED